MLPVPLGDAVERDVAGRSTGDGTVRSPLETRVTYRPSGSTSAMTAAQYKRR